MSVCVRVHVHVRVRVLLRRETVCLYNSLGKCLKAKTSSLNLLERVQKVNHLITGAAIFLSAASVVCIARTYYFVICICIYVYISVCVYIYTITVLYNYIIMKIALLTYFYNFNCCKIKIRAVESDRQERQTGETDRQTGETDGRTFGCQLT